MSKSAVTYMLFANAEYFSPILNIFCQCWSRTPCLVDLAWEILPPMAHGPGPMAPGKISQARCPRLNMSSIGEKICSIDKKCSIGEKYAALAKNTQHWQTLCKLFCFLTCVLQNVVKTEATSAGPSPSTAPAHKKYSGGHRS